MSKEKEKNPWALYQVHTPAGVIKNLTIEQAQDYKKLYGYFYTKME